MLGENFRFEVIVTSFQGYNCHSYNLENEAINHFIQMLMHLTQSINWRHFLGQIDI